MRERQTPDVRFPMPDPSASAALILIVEDSPTQALKLEHLLASHGYRVVAAHNGREALERMEEQAPTVVISDITMPEMDGYELCRRIRTDARLGSTPVILLTSLSDPKDVVLGLQCGANNFITKPYDDAFLLSHLHYILANQELRRTASAEMGIEIFFAGQKHFLTSDRLQMIDLLLSSYDNAVQKNRELQQATEKLERQTQELARSNSELEQFAYIASHDLQEPLRAVSSFVDLLGRRYGEQLDEKGRQYITFAVEGAKRMHTLIQDLLAYSRVGTKAKEFARVELSKVLRDALANLRVAIEETGAEVTHDDALPTVQGDATQLTQLLQNLVGNGLKFRAEGRTPRVHVAAVPRGGEWALSVRDNGIGIEEKDFARIFDVFQRLHERTRYPGTGIGLAVCKKIVERHGGRIWVESRAGEGTAFNFTLPAMPQAPAAG